MDDKSCSLRERFQVTRLFSLCVVQSKLPQVNNKSVLEALFSPSVEQVQGRDRGFFRFLDLWFGQLDATHGNHSTYSEVCGNTAHSQPERPVQAVVQHNKDEEILLVVCHPFSQTVASHGCQETQNTQGSKKSCKQKSIL